MKAVKTYIPNPWDELKQFTQARIAIGRCGTSIPTKELLDFKLSHAKAIDAVNISLDSEALANEITTKFGISVHILHSAAKSRSEYLRRPDLGRTLSEESKSTLHSFENKQNPDISLVIADGLSSFAVEKNIVQFLASFLPLIKKNSLSLSPITLVEQARVAIADEIGEIFNAKMSVILIGERPGLKTPDSLGIYMTYQPTCGTTDERRNCISNVRPEGLSYEVAAQKLMYLIQESFHMQISGVNLKDEQDTGALQSDNVSIIEKENEPF